RGGDAAAWDAHAAVLEPQPARLGRRLIVQPAVDAEDTGHATGADRALDAADQDGGGPVARADDEVEHLVDAVAEINIPHAARLVEDARPRRAAGARVTGLVGFAIVRLHLDDHPRLLAAVGQAPDEIFAQQ